MLRFLSDLSLEKRLPLLAGVALLVILAAFTLLDLKAVNDSRNQALQERLVTAQMVASHIDLTLDHALKMLAKTAALVETDLEDGNLEAAKARLAFAYEQSGLFSHSLFLLDREGTVLGVESRSPSFKVGENLSYRSFIRDAITSERTCVSGVQCSSSGGASTVCLTAPIVNSRGETIGLVGGSIFLTDPEIGGFVNMLRLGETGYAHVVDADGWVLASTTAEAQSQMSDHGERFAALIADRKAVVATCHNCHESDSSVKRQKDILAFAPVSVANWGVAIRQSEDEVFAPARELERKFIYLASLSVLAVVFFVWLFTGSITRPLASITSAAERIAARDISRGVSVARKDEIGRLARVFEAMRVQLRDSLGQITDWNRELEERVRQRTAALEESGSEIARLYKELQEKEQARAELLRKIITVQEEERRRLARDLHDEASQSLAALAVGLETIANSPGGSVEDAKRRVEALKPLVIETLAEVHKLIFDLRPSSLDDLGLVAVLQSYAEFRLENIGIKVQLQADSLDQRLPAPMESALFRIVQEAMTNVVKHAEADNVTISLRFHDGEARATVEDDGRGFDVDQVLSVSRKRRGFGLLGIAVPTWKYGTLHNIQKKTPQNSTCNACHGNSQLFLMSGDIKPGEMEADRKVMVPTVPHPR